jgi:hypothetical protein
MEKNQEKTLNVIYNGNHSTYEELLAISKSPSLKIRRISTIAKAYYRKEFNPYRVVLTVGLCAVLL